MFIFPYWLGVIGYSVESSENKIRPISILFIFDRLLPAYRIREENYKIARYYVASRATDVRPTSVVRHFGKDWVVAEATEQERERIERYLDLLKFSGLVFTIFIIAAISKLAR
jgi:hypothetical protein